MKKYQIIYADPPWSYNDKMIGHGGAESEYQTQGLEWIKSLKVGEIADKNCVLFLWAVSPLLPEAFEVITAWGFKYKTVGFCWNKLTSDGILISNMGRWTMGNIELCLIATKGSPRRICKNVKQQVSAIRENHSKKPDIVRRRIVDLMGNLPRIELFCRDNGLINLFNEKRMDGWDTFGNEVKSDITL